MSISTIQYTVATSHGSLVVEEHGKGGTPILLIHGNSSCRGVFQHQLHGQLADNYRFIAFDLPGHGQSSDAPDPARTYTLPGLAEAAVELLEKLRITQIVVFGKAGKYQARRSSWERSGSESRELTPRRSTDQQHSQTCPCGPESVRDSMLSFAMG